MKGKEKCRGLCDQGTAGDYVQCPCHPGAACAVCSTKLKNVRIWVPALTAAMKDGNGAVHMEAGFSLPKAMLASPHHWTSPQGAPTARTSPGLCQAQHC